MTANFKNAYLNKSTMVRYSEKDFLNALIFVVFLLVNFAEGMIFEIFWLGSLTLLLLCNFDKIYKYRREKIIRFYIIFAVFFILFSLFHMALISIRPDNLIRLYGLTKCIIMPSVLFLCMYKNKITIVLWKIVLLFLICLNIAFFYAHILQGLLSINGLGSVNVIGGLNIIVLPLICLRTNKQCKTGEFVSNSILIFLIILNAILFDATTYKVLTVGFVFLLLIFRLFSLTKYKSFYCRICGIAIICLILLPVFLVVTDILPEDSFLYDSRYIIWQRAFGKFTNFTAFSQWMGSGNNIVQMVSKSLEAHNITMDILLIYGWFGVLVLLLFFIGIVKYSYKINLSYRWLFLTSFIFYTVICFMNPFFSGVLYFQVVSWVAFMVFINYENCKLQSNSKLDSGRKEL